MLRAVQRIVGGVHVENNLVRRLGVLAEEHLDEEVFKLRVPGGDFFIARGGAGPGRRQFQAIERVATGQGLAPVLGTDATGAGRIVMSASDRQQRIVPQFVMVVEVFVAEGDAEHPLGEQMFEAVFDQVGIAEVVEAFGQGLDAPEPLVDLAEQQCPAIGGDGFAGELGNDFPTAERLKFQRGGVTYTVS